MKKFISYILLLVMCVSLFAGCANEQPQEDTALSAAAEYLYAMYKDAKSTTDADFTVVSQVRVDGVTYPITWTADKADNVQIAAGENNMTTIKITAGEEDVNYKLTATLKNEQGQEASVSFDYIIPAKAQVAGKTMVLAYPKENLFITGSHYLYTGKNKWQLNLTANEAEAVALEVLENSDGTVTFKAGDQYLFCDANHVKFVSAQDDNTKFVLEAADTEGGYFIKCAVANYNGKAQYLEVYSGYLTCYGMGSDPSIYVFKLQESTTAAGTISGLEDTPAPTDPAPTTPAATDPAPTTPANPSDPKPTTPAPTEPKPTTPANPSTPSSDKVVLSYPKENKYITGAQYSYTSSSGNTKIELTLSENKADAIALEKITNADGTVAFKAGSQYLFCDGTDVKFVTAQSDNTKFVLEAANGGYFIKCAVANYNGKAQYLEVYKAYLTCYSMGTDASIYTFKLDNASGANGSITAPSTGDSGNTGNSGNSGNTGTNNNTGTTVTINGKLAASIDMNGTTTRISYSTSQTVHSANGIKYTNDKASSTTNNYDQTKQYAARAYKSSTVKVEYTGMVAIVFHLDDYSPEAGKDYMSGFDSMTVAGATITRNGADVTITFDKATNVFQSAELGSQIRILSIDVYTK